MFKEWMKEDLLQRMALCPPGEEKERKTAVEMARLHRQDRVGGRAGP